MKKIILLITSILLLTGCEFKEDFSDTYIYTTLYPIEYATNFLYSDYAVIQNVYPNGADINYKITDKRKETFSKGQTFIYSGVANEASLAKDVVNLNKNIQLIDATKYIPTNSKIASVWIDPSNYLKLCNNIKSNLINYTDNVYIKESIETKYKELNEKISELDVQLYDIGKNGNYNTILTTNSALNYLTKYNINVISLDTDNTSIDKAYSDAKKLISSKDIQYIYYLEGEKLNQTQEKLISDNSLIKVEINDMFSLTDQEREENKDYLTIMNETIENYKKELFKN